MKFFLFVALILATFLRGLAGDAMAISAAAQGVAALSVQKTNVIHVAPCHSVSAEMEQTDDAPLSDATEPSCENCQACHLTIVLNKAAPSMLNSFGFAQPWNHEAHWQSTEPQSVSKPPIL